MLFKLQEKFKSPLWVEKGFKITNEDTNAANIRKTLIKVSAFYHPDKLGLDM